MKLCPECRRDYADETLNFCLDDGATLLDGPASAEEPATAVFGVPPSGGSSSESETRPQIHRTAEAEPRVISEDAKERQSLLSAHRAAKPLAALVLTILILLAGFFGYRYLDPLNSKQIDSIAVMPFVNESGNADIEYLSDGMTETLISSLTQLPNLNVKARSTVFRYKGKQTDTKTIGRELNVQAILNGHVTQRGDQLTLSLELVDVRTENAIWSQQYTRRQTDLVTLQSEIAKDVSGKLKLKLSGADVAKVEKTYTADPAAYQLFLKGRFYWNQRTSESLKKAVELYQQAIEQDPNYALAYAGLAQTYVIFPLYSLALPSECMPKARAMALRALEIDDSLAEAHVALGSYFTYFEFDRVASERAYRRAIELNPNYATAHQWLGNNVLNPTKRFDEGLASLRRAEEIDPLSAIIGANLGDSFLYMRQYDRAIMQYNRVLELDPNFAFARFSLGWCLYVKGMYQEAVEEFRRSLSLNYDPTTKGYLAMALARSGQRSEAVKLLDELKKESLQRYVSGVAMAVVYIGLSDRDQALEWLEKDVDQRASYTCFLSVDPVYDEMRNDARFKAMLKRLNLPE